MNKRTPYFCTFLLLWIWNTHVVAQRQNFHFQRLSSEHGLSQSSVRALAQDYRGFIWCGTEDGLNKYDGYKFTVYTHQKENPQSIGSDRINCIFEDRQHNLWVGTLGGGLCLYNRKQDNFTVYTYPKKSPNEPFNDDIRAILEDKNGNLWVAMQTGGLFLFDKKTKTFVTQYQTFSEDIRVLYEDKIGQIWVGMNGTGLHVFDPKQKKFTQHFTVDNGLTNNYITAITEDPRGHLWVGTEAGISVFDPYRQTFSYYTQQNSALPDNIIRMLARDTKNQIWIGTESSGLIHWVSQKNTFISYQHDLCRKNSLGDNTVASFLEDRNGNFWVGSYTGGVTQVSKEDRFTGFNTQNSGLSHDVILSIIQTRDDRIWLGTDGGGLNLYNPQNQTFKTYKYHPDHPNTISTDVILALAEDQHGKIWAGTYMGGLNVFDPKTESVTRYLPNKNDTNSLSHTVVWGVYEDSRGTIWVGTNGGGLQAYNPENDGFITYQTDRNRSNWITNNDIRVMFEDSRGQFWIGSYGGGLMLFDRDKNHFKSYIHQPENPNSISHNTVIAIHEDRQKNLWIATYGGGLNRFNPKTEKFEHFTSKDGLAGDIICGILEDNNEVLWVSTNKGLSKLNPKTKQVINYNRNDGLQSDEFMRNAFCRTREGKMYFGGLNGFDIFDPQQVQDEPFTPQVVLTDFMIFNKEIQVFDQNSPLQQHISEAQQIELEYDRSVITFHFSALSFLPPEKNLYAYQLEGFDKNWHDVKTKRTATYTNLDPGNYTFKVKATNRAGVWGNHFTSIKLVIRPPFWQKWWFKLLSFLAVVGSASGYYVIRLRSIQHQKERLQVLVKERTREIVAKNQELRRAEQDKSTLVRQKLRNEIEYKTGELASSTLHLVQKTRLMEQLKKDIKTIREKTEGEVSRELRRLIRRIDQGFEIDKEWDNFNINFERLHKGFLATLTQRYPDLTKGDLRLCTLYKVNLSSAEIAEILQIAPNSVKVARHRLRKKLELDPEQDLVKFLASVAEEVENWDD